MFKTVPPSNQGVLFDDRFLETITGPNILRSPRVAIIELIANAWDAGATRVDIDWPNSGEDRMFRIKDNGHGLTKDEFETRWRTMAYNRLKEQGDIVQFPTDVPNSTRVAFGRNGVGRFAGFYFAEEYFVQTAKDGIQCTFRVARGGQNQPIILELLEEVPCESHGTTVYVETPSRLTLKSDQVRAEVGTRFLIDPSFEVYVDGERVGLDFPR